MQTQTFIKFQRSVSRRFSQSKALSFAEVSFKNRVKKEILPFNWYIAFTLQVKSTLKMYLKITLLALFCTINSGILYGQSERFFITETYPENYELGVELETTIQFTFSEPVDTDQEYADDLPLGILYAGPEDSISLDNFRFNEDRTVFMVDAVQTPDTEFTWVITIAKSESGKFLNPATLNYSTSHEGGSVVVQGLVSISFPTKGIGNSEDEIYVPGAFALSTKKPNSGFQTNTPEELVYASTILQWDGDAEIKNVKPGVYWPVAFVEYKVEGNFSYADFDGFGFYSLDYDQEPDSIVVEADTDTINIGFIEMEMGTSVEPDESDQPLSFTLYQNYPNPFNPSTTVPFELNSPERVHIYVYNLFGQRISEYDLGFKTAGTHHADINLDSHASGIYYVNVIAGGQTRIIPVTMVK